ncbi:DUF1573 domain-containing protein [Bacteroidota bacterium]
MRRMTIFIPLVIIFSFLALISKPKMVFDCGKTYDWGTVMQKDSPLKADIKLYNKGDDTLLIKRVKPMCGCTTAPLSKKVVPPGDSAVLKVTLNVGHYEGQIQKRIAIISNLHSAETFLNLSANVYMPIKLFPNNYLNFGQMYVSFETVNKVVINNLSDHDINITELVFKPEDLIINMSVGDVIPKDSNFVLEAKVLPSEPGPYTCRIDINTDDPDQPSIMISGWGRVDPASKKKEIHQNIVADSIDHDKIKLIKPPVISPDVAPLDVHIDPNVKIQQIPNLQVLPNKQVKFQVPDNKLKIRPDKIQIEVKPIEEKKIIEDNKPKEEKKSK